MSTPSAEPLTSQPPPPVPRPPPPAPSVALDAKEPIRAELFGPEPREAHARELAASYGGPPRYHAEGPLLKRLRQNQRILVRAHRRAAEVAGRSEPLSPDAEWLLDNFYVVEGVLREVRHDLPRGYYRELPKLPEGPLAGYPRVYALALALIAHTDSTLDEAHVTRFVQAYQSVAPLTIGELWAVPTMLRLGLLENLRRLAEQMSDTWDEHARADAWVAPLLEAGRDGGRPLPELAPLAPASPQGGGARGPGDPFVVRSMQVLRSAGTPEALE